MMDHREWAIALVLIAGVLTGSVHAQSSGSASACTAVANDIGKAKQLFTRSCPGQTRRDCDPTNDGRWQCSSAIITSGAVTAPAPIVANPVVVAGSCAASASQLGAARDAFADQCAGFNRKDCDQVSGGRWMCSSENIVAGAAETPSAPTPAAAQPVVAESESSPEAARQVSGGVCSVTAANLGAARDAFADQCAGYTRADCDPADGNRWQCSSGELSGGGVVAAVQQRSVAPADSDGNGVSDVFEADSSASDRDGDFIADTYDVDITRGSDRNGNGVDDRFESAVTLGDDNNRNGLLDRYEATNERRVAGGNVPLPAPPRTPLLVVDFESGTINSGHRGLGPSKAPASDAHRLNTRNPRSGSYAIEHTVKLSNAYRSNGAWRSESDTVSLRQTRYDQGDKVRYMFSTYLQAPWPSDRANPEIIFQWKRFSSRPDMFVAVSGNEIVLRALSGSRALSRTIVQNYKVGKWMDFMFDITWSASGSGTVEMFFKYADEGNYRRVSTYRGANMGASGPRDSTYLKWGNYKPKLDSSSFSPKQRTILHDDIRIIPLD